MTDGSSFADTCSRLAARPDDHRIDDVARAPIRLRGLDLDGAVERVVEGRVIVVSPNL